MEMFVFKGIILQEDNSYSALCPELDLASQGASPTEAKAALLEAATLHLEGSFEDGLPYLRPIPTGEDPRNDPSATISEIFTLYFVSTLTQHGIRNTSRI